MDITSYCRLSSTVPNHLHITWEPDPLQVGLPQKAILFLIFSDGENAYFSPEVCGICSSREKGDIQLPDTKTEDQRQKKSRPLQGAKYDNKTAFLSFVSRFY